MLQLFKFGADFL